jgi:hypothetical protein
MAYIRFITVDNNRGRRENQMTSNRIVAVPSPAAEVNSAAPRAASAQTAATPAGLHDFDFFIGEWKVHHRQLKERLVGSHEWMQFEGTTSTRKILGGLGNMDDNLLDKPGSAYRAVTLRSFDPANGQWSIWWLDGRTPSANLDPSMKGRFENGIGTFHADDTLDGKPICVRFTWSHSSATACHWEQAFSPDGGTTWETNWSMDFRRSG